MKSMITVLALVLSSHAFAGTEVVYLTPFSKQVTELASSKLAQLTVDSARLTEAATQVLVDDRTCDLDSTSFCPKRTVLESVAAVEINFSYVVANNTSEDNLVSQKLYIDPTTLPSATLAALQSAKVLKAKKANQLFALQTYPQRSVVQAVDYENSVLCEETVGANCRDQIVYVQKTINKIQIKAIAK